MELRTVYSHASPATVSTVPAGAGDDWRGSVEEEACSSGHTTFGQHVHHTYEKALVITSAANSESS